MNFNNTTTKDGIIQEIERMTDLGSAYISSDTTRLREFTAIVNRVGHRVRHLIFTCSGNWQYDDGNNTNLPSGVTDMTSGTANYAIPDVALTVQRIEVLDENDNWYKLKPMTKEQIPYALEEFMDVANTPLYYKIVNGTYTLYPTPSYSKTGGIKVFFDRDSVDFAYDDTTKTPGFASPYHEIIPIKASIEWLKIKQPTSPTLTILMQDDMKLEQAIKTFYSRRFKDYQPRITRRYDSFI